MFFTTTVINIISTIAAESPDVASAEATYDFSNDQESVEGDYSKTNNIKRSSVQDHITKFNGVNDIQKITTEDISASVLLELQSQQVRPESYDYLNTDFFFLNPWNILQKKVRKKIRQ